MEKLTQEIIGGLEFTIIPDGLKTYYVRGRPEYQVVGLPIYFPEPSDAKSPLIVLKLNDNLLLRLRIKDLSPERRKELGLDSSRYNISDSEMEWLRRGINDEDWRLNEELRMMRDEEKRGIFLKYTKNTKKY